MDLGIGNFSISDVVILILIVFVSGCTSSTSNLTDVESSMIESSISLGNSSEGKHAIIEGEILNFENDTHRVYFGQEEIEFNGSNSFRLRIPLENDINKNISVMNENGNKKVLDTYSLSYNPNLDLEILGSELGGRKAYVEIKPDINSSHDHEIIEYGRYSGANYDGDGFYTIELYEIKSSKTELEGTRDKQTAREIKTVQFSSNTLVEEYKNHIEAEFSIEADKLDRQKKISVSSIVDKSTEEIIFRQEGDFLEFNKRYRIKDSQEVSGSQPINQTVIDVEADFDADEVTIEDSLSFEDGLTNSKTFVVNEKTADITENEESTGSGEMSEAERFIRKYAVQGSELNGDNAIYYVDTETFEELNSSSNEESENSSFAGLAVELAFWDPYFPLNKSAIAETEILDYEDTEKKVHIGTPSKNVLVTNNELSKSEFDNHLNRNETSLLFEGLNGFEVYERDNLNNVFGFSEGEATIASKSKQNLETVISNKGTENFNIDNRILKRAFNFDNLGIGQVMFSTDDAEVSSSFKNLSDQEIQSYGRLYSKVENGEYRYELIFGYENNLRDGYKDDFRDAISNISDNNFDEARVDENIAIGIGEGNLNN